MAHSKILVQLQYLIQPAGQQTPDEMLQEEIAFSLPTSHYSVGAGNQEPDGAVQPRNLLALEQRKQGTKLVGYKLRRLAGMRSFDYEIDRDGLEEVVAYFKLTWFDPTDAEAPFTLVYPLKPFDSMATDQIDNPEGSTNIEYLLKESSGNGGEITYFLRRLDPDGAGDDLIDFCDKSQKELEELEVEKPNKKGAINRLIRARKKADCDD